MRCSERPKRNNCNTYLKIKFSTELINTLVIGSFQHFLNLEKTYIIISRKKELENLRIVPQQIFYRNTV